MPRTAPRISRATRRPVPRPASSRRAGRGRGATGVRLPGERSRLAGGGNHRPFSKSLLAGTPADRVGRTRGAADQARLRSRGVTARGRVPQVMRLGRRASGRASVNSQTRDAASRKTTYHGRIRRSATYAPIWSPTVPACRQRPRPSASAAKLGEPGVDGP
jgi:hypothetical protein